MFHEALNAPWLLIILYLLPLAATVLLLVDWLRRWRFYAGELLWLVLAALLLGAGIALLGAAYLHDVWYC